MMTSLFAGCGPFWALGLLLIEQYSNRTRNSGLGCEPMTTELTRLPQPRHRARISDGVTHDDRPVCAAASCAQIEGANWPDRQADASASMLRRARLRTVPGESPNSAAVSANAGADISPCPPRQTVRTPNRSVCSISEQSRRRSPDPIKPTCSPQDNTSLSSSLGETCSCSCCSGTLSVGTVRRSAHDGRFSAPSRAIADLMFASTLPAIFWCRHQGNCRISSQSWLATSASVSGPAGACRATAIAPGSNAHATTHAADQQSPPEGEPIWTNACSTSSAASMPTTISQSRSPSTAGADASRGSCSTQSGHSCRELVAAGEQPVTSDVIPIQRNRTRSKL